MENIYRLLPPKGTYLTDGTSLYRVESVERNRIVVEVCGPPDYETFQCIITPLELVDLDPVDPSKAPSDKRRFKFKNR